MAKPKRLDLVLSAEPRHLCAAQDLLAEVGNTVDEVVDAWSTAKPAAISFISEKAGNDRIDGRRDRTYRYLQWRPSRRLPRRPSPSICAPNWTFTESSATGYSSMSGWVINPGRIGAAKGPDSFSVTP